MAGLGLCFTIITEKHVCGAWSRFVTLLRRAVSSSLVEMMAREVANVVPVISTYRLPVPYPSVRAPGAHVS